MLYKATAKLDDSFPNSKRKITACALVITSCSFCVLGHVPSYSRPRSCRAGLVLPGCNLCLHQEYTQQTRLCPCHRQWQHRHSHVSADADSHAHDVQSGCPSVSCECSIAYTWENRKAQLPRVTAVPPSAVKHKGAQLPLCWLVQLLRCNTRC